MLYWIILKTENVVFYENLNVFAYIKLTILNMTEVLINNINMHVAREK